MTRSGVRFPFAPPVFIFNLQETNGDGSKTETRSNKAGSVAATAVLVNQQVTTTSADGKTVTINRDSTGGGWFDSQKIRSKLADGSRTLTVKMSARDHDRRRRELQSVWKTAA
jgi:hypothetical protein